jgi:ketosteroid isomerase-like protein
MRPARRRAGAQDRGMTNPLRQSLLLAVSLAAVACGAPAASESTSTTAQASRHGDPRAALLAADDALAAAVAAQGYASGLAASLSGKVVYLHEGQEILVGRRTVREFLATVPEAGTTLFHRVAAGASADGELGYSFGWTEVQDAAGAVLSYGKYMAAWKGDDGCWKIDAFLLMNAIAETVPPPPDAGVLAGYAGAPVGGHHPRAGAMQADRDFAALSASLTSTSGYGPAFIAYADANAVVFGRRNFRFGTDWIRLVYGGTIAGEELSWGPLHGGAAESGDLAWTAGNAVYRYQDPTVSIVDYSKYLTVWARQADGSWKWLLDAGTSRPAPAPAP